MEDDTIKQKIQLPENLQRAREEAEKRLQENQLTSHLTSIKHPQKDFFIADIFDCANHFSSDLASMEYPVFALKAGDTKDRYYRHNGVSINIRATSIGLATIHDKDIWLYCISKLQQAMLEGEQISQIVRFTIYDYLVTTNRLVNGKTYELTKNALDRLAGTRIKIEHENKEMRLAKGFGLIENWLVVERKDGRMVRVEVKLPDWLYQSITSKKLLSISPDYFRLRKPIDRRIYELARKHCGYQSEFIISLELLHKKCGATSPLRNFRIAIKSLADSNQLPDYFIFYYNKKDQVIFVNRNDKASLKKYFMDIKKKKI